MVEEIARDSGPGGSPHHAALAELRAEMARLRMEVASLRRETRSSSDRPAPTDSLDAVPPRRQHRVAAPASPPPGAAPAPAQSANRRQALGRLGIAALLGGLLTRASERVAHATSGTSPEGSMTLGANDFTMGRTTNTATTTTQLDATGGGTEGGLQVNNSGGSAVRAICTIGYPAVHATSANFYGVHAVSTALEGVLGQSTNSPGVRGTSINSDGVVGASSNGFGVRAFANAGGGTIVNGFRLAGVYGQANKNVGVYGYDSGTPNALPSFGAVGHSPSAYGVFGYSGAPAGQLVNSPIGVPPGLIAVAGVFGTSNGNPGVYGISGTSIGVVGQSQSIGVLGGLIAGAAPTALAGLFLGNVEIQGSLTVTGSYPKSAAIPHPDGTHRRFCCVEAPEPYLEDFGEGRFEAGRATVTLDPDFAAVVRGDRYHVFVTPHDDVHLHVRNRSARGFEVRLTTSGAAREAEPAGVAAAGRGPQPAERPSVAFSWRVVARRRDIAGPRLERVEVAAAPIPRPEGVPTLPAGASQTPPRGPSADR